VLKKIPKIEKSKISELPKTSGVYVFYDKKGNILYIGKASNIKERVKSHLKSPSFRDSLFLKEIAKIGFKETESEIEALILEAHLIKKHQPKFNVLWKDDKNYFYVGITKEEFPRIFLTHQIKLRIPNHKLSATSYQLPTKYIGPFVDGKAIKQTLRVLRKVFPYRSCKTIPKRPCLWHQLELCPGPCKIKFKVQDSKLKTAKKSATYIKVKKDCQKNAEIILKILQGKRSNVLKGLKKEMKKFSESQEYEKAAKIRDQIYSLENIITHSKIFNWQNEYVKPWRSPWFYDKWEMVEKELKKIIVDKNEAKEIKRIVRIEGYDISNIQGKEAVGVMVVFTNGKPDKKEYRKFKIRITGKPNDTAMIKEVLTRRFNHSEWKFPDLILIDGGKGQLNAAKLAIKQFNNLTIKTIALAKRKNELFIGGRKNPILLKNLPPEISNLILQIRDESHRFALSYHRKLRERKFII